MEPCHESSSAVRTAKRIDKLAAGSWIFGNLETWIGEGEQNRAWEYLAIARAQVVSWERGGRRSNHTAGMPRRPGASTSAARLSPT